MVTESNFTKLKPPGHWDTLGSRIITRRRPPTEAVLLFAFDFGSALDVFSGHFSKLCLRFIIHNPGARAADICQPDLANSAKPDFPSPTSTFNQLNEPEKPTMMQREKSRRCGRVLVSRLGTTWYRMKCRFFDRYRAGTDASEAMLSRRVTFPR
jgi:hypothetical protein